MPARDRVYADIKARSATRYAPMTVAAIVGEQDKELMLGSYAVPGTFTRAAWEGYIQGAIKEAANKVLAIQGVGDLAKPVIDSLVAKLETLAKPA